MKRYFRNPTSVLIWMKGRVGRIILVFSLSVSTAIACGWSLWTDDSVRFNTMRTGRGFYRLPPLPIQYDPLTGKELTASEVENYYDPSEDPDNAKANFDEEPNAVWDQARSSMESGELSDLRNLLSKYLDLTEHGNSLEDGEWQERRNSAFDMLDAITALKRGSKPEAVKAYLAARYAFHHDPAEVENHFDLAVSDRNLDDNWAYLRAAKLFHAGAKDDALTAFRAHDLKFPYSEKNEAVLYMIATLIMARGDELAKECEDQNCKIDDWRAALAAFKTLMFKHPKGRYFEDAQGWTAHLYRHEGRLAKSLAEYYRLLGNESRKWRLEAKKSLQMIGHDQDDATLDEVERLIADEPDTALAYSYHRIYNHAADHSYAEFQLWCCYGDDKWTEIRGEKQRVKDEQDKGRHELERIARFATAMVKRYGLSRVSGAFVLRIAQSQIELQNFGNAAELAVKAIKMGVKGELRAQALWIKGSSEHHQKKLKAARATFSQLISEFPNDKLTDGARRLLAMTAEDQGDLEFALEQYLALKYEYDVAYFVDVLMPTDRLANYIASREQSGSYDYLLYALGVRYMRDGRWNEAREAFLRVETKSAMPTWASVNDGMRGRFPKIPEWDVQEPGIKSSWVLRDLKTIDRVVELELTIDAAEGDDLKAEAMYQLASFYYEASALLFYNPAAWAGTRYHLLSDLNVSANLRRDGESQIILDHFQSHDTVARALPIYLKIVDRFPRTRAAKDALYSAAVAHERLSDLNPFWRSTYEQGLFAGTRKVSYADVKRLYPEYQLPRGTYGWEPSTRTVNGGPGWAPPPKPLPKTSRTDRAIKTLAGWLDDYLPTVTGAVSSTASSVSDRLISYFRVHLYLVFAALTGYVLWANRREIYEGPVSKCVKAGYTLAAFLNTNRRD